MRLNLSKYMDLDEVKRLYRADIPTPVDVLNLIHFKDREAYRWYGLMVLPTLKAVGGQVGWFGDHVHSFVGEPQAEDLGVVRYPNQRRFFALGAGLGPWIYGVYFEADGNYDSILRISAVLFVAGALPLLLLGKYRTFEEPLEE